VADGNINMTNEELDLRLLAKPKNFSPLTLRSPILIKGTFANPQTSIDKGPVAAKVAGSIFLGLLNPLAAILPLIDFGEGVDPSTESNCQQSLKGLQLPASAGKQAEVNTKKSNKSSQPQSNSKEAIEALF
jgi:AsmA protein